MDGALTLQYLGTSAAEGWPATFCNCESCTKARIRGGRDIRTRSQALIDRNILIDLPEDTLMHANLYGLQLGKINHLLITHAHLDHFAPFTLQMRVRPYAQKSEKLHIYCNETVLHLYESVCNMEKDSRINSIEFYIDKYQNDLEFHVIHSFDSFGIKDYYVEALRASHTPSEECLFYRISRNGKSILYANDTGYFPEETWHYLKGKYHNIVSMDCTYCTMPCGSRHMGLEMAAQAKSRMLSEKMADDNTIFLLTHFTHNCSNGMGYEELADAAKKYGFQIAYDGLSVKADYTEGK